MLVTSNFSISHNVFYLSQDTFFLFLNLFTFILSSSNPFHLDWSKILSSGTELILYQTTKFWTGQKLTVFADENSNENQKLEFSFGRVENLVGKGEYAGYQHFLIFSSRFSN